MDIKEILRNHYVMPENIRRLAAQASFDLQGGGGCCGEEDYPGFESANEAIADWADKNLPSECWIECGNWVLENEPEGYLERWTDEDGEECEEWVEPCWEDYTYVRSVRREYFGGLADYL